MYSPIEPQKNKRRWTIVVSVLLVVAAVLVVVSRRGRVVESADLISRTVAEPDNVQKCAMDIGRLFDQTNPSDLKSLASLPFASHAVLGNTGEPGRDFVVVPFSIEKLTSMVVQSDVVVDLKSQREWVEIDNGKKIVFSFPNDVVVTADTAACAVVGVYVPAKKKVQESTIHTAHHARPKLVSDAVKPPFYDANNHLARRFAPWMYFARDQKGFPMDAETYYNFKKTNRDKHAYIENKVVQNTVTYFFVARCGAQIRIVYWWFYGYQPACLDLGVVKFGHHRGDWEHSTVILKRGQTSIDAVIYDQHGGHLTKLASGVKFRDGRPIIYVGKLSHGSYPDDKIRNYHFFHQCSYFGDPRTPSPNTMFDVQRGTMYQINPNFVPSNQQWMKDFGFCKVSSQCEISTRPQYYARSPQTIHAKYCVGKPACDDTGCEESECMDGRYRQQEPITGTFPKCCRECCFWGWCSGIKTCDCKNRDWVIPQTNIPPLDAVVSVKRDAQIIPQGDAF